MVYSMKLNLTAAEEVKQPFSHALNWYVLAVSRTQAQGVALFRLLFLACLNQFSF